MSRKVLIFSLGVILLSQTVSLKGADPGSGRKDQLALVLKAVQKEDDSGESQENPGFYDPANRRALKDFIERYPKTDEALHAEVWLAFAEGITERSPDPVKQQRNRAARAERMKQIAATTTNSATAKIAQLIRIGELFNVHDWAAFETEVRRAMSRIKEYESEKDDNFLCFCKLNRTPASELEPFYSWEIMVHECYLDHLNKALLLAEELQRRFPDWSKREGIGGNIELLKQGQSPYPKMPPF